jgi:hypothetical protein
MRPVTRRRLCWALVVGVGLTALTVVILAFVDATAMEDAKRCAPSIWLSQWPKYIGCAAAAHEGLAGGLVGAAGALFAAWLAFDAIQEQLGQERERAREERQRQDQMQAEEPERRERTHAEAKEAAVVCIAPTVHAAAGALMLVERALQVTGEAAVGTDRLVALAMTHIQSELSSFTVQESLRDLGLDDRLLYLSIIGTLSVLVNISTNPSPALDRTQWLEGQRHALMNLHIYLRAFSPDELARVYARDSGTQPGLEPLASMGQAT